MKKGHFISFEGVDGSGKSTQIEKLKKYLENRGYSVILTREPGGTDISEKIRELILDPENTRMSDMTEMLLYAASRAQHVSEVIKPALRRGDIVICDRFVDSSIAYQGYGRGLGAAVDAVNDYAVAGCMPEITFWMKVRPDVGSKRIDKREKDRIENEKAEFHESVFRGYEALEKKEPQRIVSVEADRSIEEIHRDITEHIDKLLCISKTEKITKI